MHIRTIVFSMAMLAGIAVTAQAEPGTAKLTPKAAAAVKKAREARPANKAPAPAGLKAAKDTDATTVRTPTPDEDAELGSSPATPTTVYVGANGSLTAVLGDEFMSDLAVVKNSDGTLTTSCGPHERGHRHVQGTKPKQSARPSPATPTQTLETK